MANIRVGSIAAESGLGALGGGLAVSGRADAGADAAPGGAERLVSLDRGGGIGFETAARWAPG